MNDNTNLRQQINQAAAVVQSGGVVAFPTDTFYGLGCDPFNAKAVEKIFQIKQRPNDKAILLLIASLIALEQIVLPLAEESTINRRFQLLRSHYWPGPLTIVLPAHSELPANLVSARHTVGVRYPNYLPAQELAAAVGGAITATSANLAGYPSVSSASGVRAQLGDSVDFILDVGNSPGGAPSSVIDLTVEPPQLVREGAINRASLMALLDRLAV
ncbi:MAG: L-threonylcarbamoyladenylate synthase [Acidobacteriota bacterium]